jgi:DNA-binding MarR family transcriptional regulator
VPRTGHRDARDDAHSGQPTTDETATDEEQVVRTLARLARLLESSCDGLTLAQYRVLGRVLSGEDRPSRISTELLLTKPTISAVLDGLQASGYITREADPDDGRMIRLAVTDAGRGAHRRAEAAMAARLDPLLDETKDRARFVAALERVAARLDADHAARRAAADGATR